MARIMHARGLRTPGKKSKLMRKQNGIAYNVNTPEKIGGGHVPSSVRTRV